MNYYKQVAEMLGLELEQEFVITDLDGKRKDTITYRFTEDGLFSKANDLSWKVTSMLDLLLTGKYKAVPKPWKPKEGDEYWRCISKNGFVSSAIWLDDVIDLWSWKSGNCFRTEGEAKTKGKEIMESIEKEFRES